MSLPAISLSNLVVNPVTGFLDSWPALFPLPAGYFIPAKMPLNLVHPRPNAETNTYARHRKYHSQMLYQIPIGFQGGAWPFKYEIVSAPFGATIGQLKGQPNYGVVNWQPNGATGPQTFTVKVTDQQLNEAVATWVTELDDAAFIFIQDGYAGTKVGTINQPLEDIVDWYKNSNTDGTYHNKIVVFRGGNYLATGNAASNPANMRMNIGYKTGMFIGFPGETPIIDMQHSKFEDVEGRTDIYISGITFRNARNDQSNAHFFVLGSYNDRATFWNTEFREMGYGTVGNDNTACIFSSSPGVGTKNHFMIKHCVFDQINNHIDSGGNGGYFDIYRTNHGLIEENVAKNSYPTYGFWAKAATSFITVRGNIAVDNVRGAQFVIPLSIAESGVTPHDMEMCWNIGRVPSTDVILMFGQSSSSVPGQTYNTWCYRNTAIGGSMGIWDYGLTPTYTDSNIFAANTTTNLIINNTGAVNPDIVVTYSSTIVDSNGKLTGPTGFGTHGGEVY